MTGIEIVDGRMTVTDWGAWMAWAPDAIAAAVADGALGATGVMIAIMRKALPKHAWPPHEEDLRYPAWRMMVGIVAKRMNLEPDPPEHPVRNLRVVG